MGTGFMGMPKMNRNIVAAIVIAVIIVATVFLLEWRPTSPVDGLFTQLHSELKAEQWDAATTTVQQLESKWKQRKTWLALNGSRNAIQNFDRLLAHLTAAIAVQDQPSAAGAAAELTSMWVNFAS